MNTTKGLKLIGKGSFTKCYLLNETTVLLKSTDPIKECMAHGWFPDSDLFPSVEFSSIEGCYEMEYYPRVSSLKKNLDSAQYAIYLELRAIYSNFRQPLNKYDTLNRWYEAFESVQNEEVKEALQDALNSCGNYGSDACFEISPRNVAVKDGKLILLDCFFLKSKL